MYYKIILPPIIGALIGWITNYMAIKMLFRPYVPVKIFGYNFQGLIPKRRKEITAGISSAIEKQLLSSSDLASVLENIDIDSEIENTVGEIVEHRFKTDKIRNIPVIGLVSENVTNHLRYFITKALLKETQKKKGTLVNKFKESLNLNTLLTSKIDSLDLKDFEALLTQFMERELRHIEIIGGLMGFLIGIVQTIIFLLIQ